MYIVYNETRQEKNFGIERNRKKQLNKFYTLDICLSIMLLIYIFFALKQLKTWVSDMDLRKQSGQRKR